MSILDYESCVKWPAGYQRPRSAAEQQMSEWQRTQLDEARRLIQTDAANHPALCAALDRIENKLDEVLALLRGVKR